MQLDFDGLNVAETVGDGDAVSEIDDDEDRAADLDCDKECVSLDDALKDTDAVSLELSTADGE